MEQLAIAYPDVHVHVVWDNLNIHHEGKGSSSSPSTSPLADLSSAWHFIASRHRISSDLYGMLY